MNLNLTMKSFQVVNPIELGQVAKVTKTSCIGALLFDLR